MATEDYNLTWKQHGEEAFKAFVDIRADQNYIDVVIFCDNEKLKAHRVILAACSSYFERLFNAVAEEHSKCTVVALTGMDPHLLALALDFMYSGKVTVPSDNLQAFMSLAELLEIRGLRSKTQDSGFGSFGDGPSTSPMPRGRGVIPRARGAAGRAFSPGMRFRTRPGEALQTSCPFFLRIIFSFFWDKKLIVAS